MREAGNAAGDRDQIELSELKEMIGGAISGIKKRGKAEVGQKTILDSLNPALQTLEEGLKDPEKDRALLIQSMIKAVSGALIIETLGNYLLS